MKPTTQQLIRIAIEGDKTATAYELAAVDALLSGNPVRPPRVYSHKEAAECLNISVSYVHQLVRNGTLTPVRARGGSRAMGITEKSLFDLATGGNAPKGRSNEQTADIV